MSILEKIDWSQFLHLSPDELGKSLVQFDEEKKSDKLVFRCYTLFSDNSSQDYDRLFRNLKSIIHKWVLTPAEIRELESDKEDPISEALTVFGDVDPSSDGKLGELILFMLIECELRAPMIFHKMAVTYDNDQARGSDAFHIGQRDGATMMFFGESKIRGNFSKGLEDAIESIDGFYKQMRSKLRNEVKVARRHFGAALPNLSKENLTELYEALSHRKDDSLVASSELAHPTLLVYNQKVDLLYKAGDSIELFGDLKKEVDRKKSSILSNIEGRSLEGQYDFFIIPVNDAAKFRSDFYEFIHGKPFIPRKLRNL